MTETEACVIINLLSGIGYARFSALLRYFGTAAAALEAPESALRQVYGIGENLAAVVAKWRDTVDYQDELAFATKAGVTILAIVDDNYPECLKQIPDPPLCLYVRGELPPRLDHALGIVGTRRMTAYGKRMAEALAGDLSRAGWTIVSGLAYGVDAAAHRATVEAEGKTVAVLAGGLARIAPQDHVPLARDIIRLGGAVVSEFPLRSPPARQSYAVRNRIISGLSQGVLVVEAALDSGAMITANFALEQNRSVFAVPGRSDDPQSTGCNKLIKEGAVLVRNIDDILEEFEFLPGFSRPKPANAPSLAEQPAALELDDEERRIFEALADEEKSVDQLGAELAMAPGKLLAKLSKLEVRKIIVQLPGKRFELAK